MTAEPYYRDDFVTLWLGDARELTAWREGVGLIVTDPPYGIGWSRGENTNAYSKPHAGILNDEDTGCRDEVLALLPGVPGIVFGSFYAPYPADVAQVLVWHKPDDAGVVGSVTGYRRDAEPVFLTGPWPPRKVRWPSVLRSNQRSIKAVTVKAGHPHTKPVDLLQGLIERAPVDPSAIVADPFAGSGSTLVAAKRIGRRAVGVELSEEYAETAAKRLAQEALVFPPHPEPTASPEPGHVAQELFG